MNTLLSRLAGLLLSFAAPRVEAQEILVAYVPNWIDLSAFADTIDYAKLTHVNVAFENPQNAGGDLSFNAQDDALLRKAHAHGVKVLVSIGGGSASDDRPVQARYFALLRAEKRATFAEKIAEYVVRHSFDGLDVDIEGPSINEDYGAFIDSLASVLKPKGKLLTAALSQGYGGNKVPDAALAQFDFVNIMAYDAAGYWNPEAPGQHASFDFARESVAYWLKHGLAKSRAVLGVPFYGYGFGEAFRKRDYPYSVIVETYAGAARLDQAGKTIWYNGIPTIQRKAAYVIAQGLGGMMIWSLDSDARGESSLLSAMHAALHAKPAAEH